MKTIEYTYCEINDLIRTLEYAKNKKREEYEKGKINENQYNFEIGLIKDLIAKVPIKTYTKKNKIDKDLIEKEEIIKIL